MVESNAISERVFRDPENELAAILRAFRKSGQSTWHIDRHVLEPTEGVRTDIGFRVSACAAGLVLLRKWSSQRLSESDSGIVISEPYLMVDDGWLEGGPEAVPPHVYICLAADEEAFRPVQHADVGVHALTPPTVLTSLLTGNETIRRMCGAFEDEPGAWLIKLDGRI